MISSSIKTASIYYLPITGFLLFCILNALNKPTGDFGNYYYASKFLTQGRWGLWIYDPASFNLAIYDEGQRNFFLNYAPVPPLSAVIYIPFTFLNIAWSKTIWNCVNAVLFLIALIRIMRQIKRPHLLLILLPLVFFTAIRNNMNEGQSYFLLFFLLVEGLFRYQMNQKWIAVILWAFSIHLKISPAIVFAFLLFERDYKTAIFLVISVVALVLCSMPIISIDVWSNYMFNILPRLFNGEINNTYAFNYQSAQVLLKTLFVPDAMHNPSVLFENVQLYKKLLISFNLIIYGLTIFATFTQVRKELKFGLWIITSMLVSGYGNSFSLLLLLFPFAFMAEHLADKKVQLFILMGMCFVIVNLPVGWFAHFDTVYQFPRLYMLLLLFGLSIYLFKTKLKSYYALLLLPVWFFRFDESVYSNNYFLTKEEALLIYDYRIDANMIRINYFDYSGPRSKQIQLPFNVKSQENLGIVDNQYKMCLLNDSVYIYLSDKNRGVGFYTLRYSLNKAYEED